MSNPNYGVLYVFLTCMNLEFFDTYDKLIPCYDIEPVEKITDAVSPPSAHTS